LKTANPADPSVIYLDGLLTKDGGDALAKYSIVADKYPSSGYADAALYKIYSYYYALAHIIKRRFIWNGLKRDYPPRPALNPLPSLFPIRKNVIGEAGGCKNNYRSGGDKERVKYNFTIQAGAFLNPDNAKKLAERLKKKTVRLKSRRKRSGEACLMSLVLVNM